MHFAQQGAFLVILCAVNCSFAGSPKELPTRGTTVFEWSFPEPSAFPLEIIIEECNLALNKVSKENEDFALSVRERRADAYMLAGKLDLAQADYKHLLARRPKDKLLLWKYALLLSRLSSPAAAERELRALIRDHPKFGKAHFGLALVRLLQRDPKEALEHSIRAIALGEQTSWVYYTRAFAYYDLGKVSEALAELDRCIAMEPLNGFTPPQACYIARGDLLLELKEPAKAVTNYLLARKLAPESFPAAYGLWTAYARLDRASICVRLADEMCKTFNGEKKAHWALAASLIAIKESRRAIKPAQRAVELDPKDALSYRTLGLAHHDLSEYKEARLNYDAAVRLAPRDRRCLFSKALLLATCPNQEFRDGEQARLIAADLRKQGKDKDADALSLYGIAQAECGDFAAALAAVQLAIALTPPENAEFRAFLQVQLTTFQSKRPLRLMGGKDLPTRLEAR